ncbi:hypothetical protein KUH03_20355 [Sphingobacterium sp. E70]|uniref:4'-phosphopantetheinyl transferase family protein n=1 Tax=Sphingobacterium sp. E70 TaxID=2853439 RepID=UPI00211BCFB3|nr:hypothetical protein [Sphingobacterium sp. E70]ULT29242.1 hypothetical protein KUH03_20355 [Sphingobacterium sp. E70]
MLRTLLNTSRYIDCPSDANGKPYLANFPQKISLSHSFDYAAAMISTEGEVGIDMEIIKTKVERIQHKFLKPVELAFISQGIHDTSSCMPVGVPKRQSINFRGIQVSLS